MTKYNDTYRAQMWIEILTGDATVGMLKAIFNNYVKPYNGDATPVTKQQLIAAIVDVADEFNGFGEVYELFVEAKKGELTSPRYTSNDYRRGFRSEEGLA